MTVGAGALLLTGCGDGDVRSEFRKGYQQGQREAATEIAAKAALAGVGVPLAGDLDCTATPPAQGQSSGPVACTGRTNDGQAVALSGRIDSISPDDRADFVRGDFTVTVGGRQVLKGNCLGPGC